MAAAKTKAPAKPKKNVQAGVISEWGPFDSNTYVTTQYGDYSVQAGQVLSFTFVEKLNKQTLEMETVAVPNRRRATDQEVADAGVDLSKMQPSQAFWDAKNKKEAPQLLEITVNGGVEGQTFPGVVKQAPVKEDH